MNIPKRITRSVYRSSTESKKPPKRLTCPELRASAPSSKSKKPAIIIAIPPHKRYPGAMSIAAMNPKATPNKVIILGLISLLQRKR